MTITYTLDVSKSRYSSFCRLLFRWRGSLWKTVYRELALWLAVYAALSSVYRLLLDKEQRYTFEDIAEFCFKYTDFIPLTFILGFFVSLVITRWWDMFRNVGWIDNTALYVTAYIDGNDDGARKIRRNVIRYLVLAQAMVFRDISPPIRLRFPTMNSLQEAGFLNKGEMDALDSIESPHSKYWLPIHWAVSLLKNAREAEYIKIDGMVMDILNLTKSERIREYRTGLETLYCYDWVPVPLVYTQVVFLTVRCYFLMALMGRQYISTDRELIVKSPIDLYFPILTVIQFLFYMGWMKVAEALLNPFGSHEDDFEVNYIIDRNLQVGMSMVDAAFGSLPPQEKDKFWFEMQATPLYSKETADVQMNPAVGSASEIPVGEKKDTLMVPRVETPAGSRKSSFSPSSGVSNFWRNVTSFRHRSQSQSKDRDTALAEFGTDQLQTASKSVPENLQELGQDEPENLNLQTAATAPGKLHSLTSKNSKSEKREDQAKMLGILMESDETEAELESNDSKIPLIRIDDEMIVPLETSN